MTKGQGILNNQGADCAWSASDSSLALADTTLDPCLFQIAGQERRLLRGNWTSLLTLPFEPKVQHPSTYGNLLNSAQFNADLTPLNPIQQVMGVLSFGPKVGRSYEAFDLHVPQILPLAAHLASPDSHLAPISGPHISGRSAKPAGGGGGGSGGARGAAGGGGGSLVATVRPSAHVFPPRRTRRLCLEAKSDGSQRAAEPTRKKAV